MSFLVLYHELLFGPVLPVVKPGQIDSGGQAQTNLRPGAVQPAVRHPA